MEAKAAVKKTTAPKKTATKAASAGKKITVIQTGSQTGVKPGMTATLKGLGLGKPRATRELQDTPAVRGMLWKVRHLVKVQGE